MTSNKNHPYAKPPTSVAVFAHLAGAGIPAGNSFVPAGQLEHLNLGADATFTYGTRYIQRPHAVEVDPVALSLKDEPGGVNRHMVQGLKEFGGIRDAAPDAWGRRVIENKLKVRGRALPEIAYLLEAGSDRVGALDVRLTLNSQAHSPANSVVNLERLLKVADKVESEEEVPADLLPYFNGLGSAGGARPKASVRDEDGVLWLAKFPAKTDRACNAVLEGGALELARAAGIRVPPVHLTEVGTHRVLMIRRFDRYWAEPGKALDIGQESWEHGPGDGGPDVNLTEGRIGLCSAMTLMGLDEQAARESSYEELAQAIRARGSAKFIQRDVREVFDRMVFNIIVNNNDDHLRNHAFVYDVAAKGWRLSPLYDVLPMNVVAQDRVLHLGVGARGREATLDNALSRWQAFHSSRQDALAAMQRVWLACRAWKQPFERFRATEREINYLDGAIRRLEYLASPALAKELRSH